MAERSKVKSRLIEAFETDFDNRNWKDFYVAGYKQDFEDCVLRELTRNDSVLNLDSLELEVSKFADLLVDLKSALSEHQNNTQLKSYSGPKKFLISDRELLEWFAAKYMKQLWWRTNRIDHQLIRCFLGLEYEATYRNWIPQSAIGLIAGLFTSNKKFKREALIRLYDLVENAQSGAYSPTHLLRKVVAAENGQCFVNPIVTALLQRLIDLKIDPLTI